MENAQTILGLVEKRRDRMDYSYITVWDVIKRFLAVWLLVSVVLIAASLVLHWDFIMASLAFNLWTLFNAVMPMAIMIFGLFYLLRLIFR